MLLFLGLGTQFSIMETITRIVVDAWPGQISHRVVLAVACCLMGTAGLSMTTQGGMYVLQMMDNHAGMQIPVLIGLIKTCLDYFGGILTLSR
jgi:SNF family Na+-dependent transporter